MKFLFSVLAALMLLGAGMATPAEARCWWNGWTTVCSPRPYYRAYRPYYRPYYRPFYRSGHYRQYNRYYR